MSTHLDHLFVLYFFLYNIYHIFFGETSQSLYSFSHRHGPFSWSMNKETYHLTGEYQGASMKQPFSGSLYSFSSSYFLMGTCPNLVFSLLGVDAPHLSRKQESQSLTVPSHLNSPSFFKLQIFKTD